MCISICDIQLHTLFSGSKFKKGEHLSSFFVLSTENSDVFISLFFSLPVYCCVQKSSIGEKMVSRNIASQT